MSKRPCPFVDEYSKQTKIFLNDQRLKENDPEYMNQVYERTNALLFEGARRAAMQPPAERYTPGTSTESRDLHSRGGPSSSDTEMDMDVSDYEPSVSCAMGDFVSGSSVEARYLHKRGESSSLETLDYDSRMSRLDALRHMEKRDPSPIPSPTNLLTSFVHTTRRTHGPISEAERNVLKEQAKTYRQLNIESFIQNRGTIPRAAGGNNPSDENESQDPGMKDCNGNDKGMEF